MSNPIEWEWPERTHQPGPDDSIWEEVNGIVTCSNCGFKFKVIVALGDIGRGAICFCSSKCHEESEELKGKLDAK